MRPLMSRRAFAKTASAATAGGFLFACGGKQNTGSSSARSAPAKGQPKPGGQLNERIPGDPSDWDLSYLGKAEPNGKAMILAYNSLLGYKNAPGIGYTDLTLQPELAASWEAPDAANYIFHLRPGVTFANLPPVNGRPLDSSDVKWSYEYWSRTGQFKDKKLPKAQFDSFFEGMTGIETPDARTVGVKFGEPFAPFIHYVASDFNPIVPHEIYDQDGNLHDRIVGTGPFQLDVASSQHGTHYIWKKNPTYWETGKPYLDEIHWLVIPDESTATAAFHSKQVDIVGEGVSVPVGFNQAQQIKRDNPDAMSYEYLAPSPYFLWINSQQHPLDDVRVRKAIALAVDRDACLKAISGGKGGWALTGGWPGDFTQEEIRRLEPHDPAQAKQLLSQGGYADGVEIPMTYPPDHYGNDFVTLLQLLQSQLKAAGINLTLKPIDNAVDSANRKKGNFSISMTPGVTEEGDVDSYLYQKFYPASKNAYGRLDDPKLNSLILAQRRESDQSKRQQITRQAALYINDVVDDLALVYPQFYYFWQPALQNVAPTWGTFGLPVTNLWLAR